MPIGYVNNTGGADLLIKHLKEIGFWETIDSSLGKRNARAEYSYSDVIQTWTMNIVSGSRRLEHSTEHSFKLERNPYFKKGMSPDTISRVMRKLAVPNTYYSKTTPLERNKLVINPTKAQHLELNEVNNNTALNELLLQTAIFLGIFEKGKKYALDIDATIIPTKVSDSRPHYKLDGTGYCPMVVFLAGIPIYMESRNGNSSPAFRKKDVLKKAIDLITSHGIGIDFVRIDAAGSNQYVLKFLQRRGIKFYIRAKSAFGAYSDIIPKWSIVPGHYILETSENAFKLAPYDFRLVDYRRKNKLDKDGLPKVRSIVTNDYDMSPAEIIHLYDQRGTVEQNFANLKEMGWNYMVHRELKFNTVHMMVTMLAHLIFIASKRWLAKKLPFVKESFQPKTFIKKFILVVTTWVRKRVKFISRQKEFAPLLGIP